MKRLVSWMVACSLAAWSGCTGAESDPDERSVHAVVVSPETANLKVDETLTLQAVALDNEGEPIEGVEFVWVSSDPAIAAVEAGAVTGKAAGHAAITASADGVTSHDAKLTVVAEQQAAFELLVSREKLPVLQGTTETLEVSVVRKNGFTGPVLITHTDLPEGAELETNTIAEGQSSIVLTLTAAAGAPHSLPTTVTLRGTAQAANLMAEKNVAVTVYGPPGSLDQSFAGGKVVLPVGTSDDYVNGVAIQADGKIVVVGQSAENLGDFAVTRLTRDGLLDTTFGTDGIVTTQIGTGQDTARAVAVQADGKIVVAGSSIGGATGLDFALARYLTDGSLDPTFGVVGKVTTSFADDSDIAYAIAIDAQGNIVLAGESNQGGSASGVDFALARYLPTGALDTTFDGDGKLTTAVSSFSGRDSAYAMVLEQVGAEQRILVAGGEGDFVLARYLPSGALDAGFGEGGTLKGVFGSSIGAARGVALTKEGKIVVAGHINHDFAMVRFSENGALDTTFGAGAPVITKISATNWDEAHGVVIEESGKIVLGGWVYEGGGSNGNFALARYTAEGVLDPSFGNAGIVIETVAPTGKRDEGHAIVLQADERVPTVRAITAGFASDSNYDLAVTRHWL